MFVHLVGQHAGNSKKKNASKGTEMFLRMCGTDFQQIFFWNFLRIDRPNAQTFNVGLITEPQKIHFGIISGKIDYKKKIQIHWK